MGDKNQMTKKLNITAPPAGDVNEAALLADLRNLIQGARQRVATVANASHTLLCGHVGRRLLKENLQDSRGAYGKQILATLSQELVADFGEGFSHSSLNRMVRFVGLEFALYNYINTPAMPLHDAHFGGFFIFGAQT
jgi:hypothetical protein